MIPKVPNHKRIKPKYNPKPNAAEKLYHQWIREYGCLVCGKYAAAHHVTHERCDEGIESHSGKDHWRMTPLCDGHHAVRLDSYHKLSSVWKFYKEHGIDLVQEAKRLLDEYSELP